MKRTVLAAMELVLVASHVAACATPSGKAKHKMAEAPPSDLQITHAVNAELRHDLAVPENDMKIRTEKGIVTLSGKVDNSLAIGRAERIAGTVRGVRAIVNLVEVQPPKPVTDQQLKSSVESALAHDRGADSSEIRVSAKDGVVTLAGMVASFPEQDLAERIVHGVAGVNKVVDRIAVDLGKPRSDAELDADVRARLRWDSLVDDELITVDVKDGKVTLRGTVGSEAAKHRARVDANGIAKEVDASQLEVATWSRPQQNGRSKVTVSDRDIENAVDDALLYDPRVNLFHVAVNSVAGTVTLSGTVDNLEAKRAAENDARNTVGVHRVNDNIHVRSSEESADATSHIRAALEPTPRYLIDGEVFRDVGAELSRQCL